MAAKRKAAPPVNPVSESAAPALQAEEFEARIALRRREMATEPCYRCDHRPVAAHLDCKCCEHAHTPDADGFFDGKTLEEWTGKDE